MGFCALGRGRGRKGNRPLLHLGCSKCGFSIYCEPSSPQRLYRSGDAESRHRYTLVPDHPDFTRARLNALHLSDVSEPAVRVVCACFCKMICVQTGFYLLKKKKNVPGREAGVERTMD